jgi:hypothetical protein
MREQEERPDEASAAAMSLRTSGARKAIAPVVRDSVAAANGIDLPKYLDAPKVGTMTTGRSTEVGKSLSRRGQTRECGTRKAKIEAKLERSRTMADKDLRQWRPEVGQQRKPIPTSPTKVPSDDLGGMGNLKKIGYNALLPMALES